MSSVSRPCGPDFPDWVPGPVRLYLLHTEAGLSLRELARREGVHASTVMRQVRRFEARRDDPLLDGALRDAGLEAIPVSPAADAAAGPGDRPAPASDGKGPTDMTALPRTTAFGLDEAMLSREGRRILRRMAETGAFLAVAPDMERAVVLRDMPDGRSVRTGVVERAVAQAFVLKDWITQRKAGRIATYEITAVGRMALRRLIERDEPARIGLEDAQTPFAAQHRDFEERHVMDEDGPKRIRFNLAESPVAVLGRRREKDGHPFLTSDLIGAAERLREDFELAQMGPRVAQNWDRFLTAGDRGGFRSDSGLAEGPNAARERVAAALRDLGPGLGDVALRCCCFLEGLEVAEKRLGWAARSGKVVLRIALQRLRRHYDETYGKSGPLIG
jgi:hypothetical protein